MATAALPTSSPAIAARPLFVATIFAGSFLLFLVQPMVARMALPRLGGAPAVWNSAMLVYQALLLGGYAYAHAIGRLPQRRQVMIHLAVLAIAASWLPLGLAAATSPPGSSPVLWVPWLLAISIGPLFFAVSAQAPLMQRWFALARPGSDPYPLYAASNLGSFGGLLAYPLLVEPGLTLAHQSLLWTAGYGALVLLVGAVAFAFAPAAGSIAAAAPAPAAKAIQPRDHARWILLSAIPSGLILATTTHLTTDIVAMPLIWVVPLGLYLLSFSIAFSGGSAVAAAVERAFPLVIVVAAGMISVAGTLHPLLAGGMDLLLLLVVSVTLHRALYRSRPDPSRLTGFYLAMSLGGVIGGAFCALAAPLLFDWVYEYPLLILLAGIAAPRAALAAGETPIGARRLRWTCVAALLLSLTAGNLLIPGLPQPVRLVALAALAILARSVVADRVAFGACLLALMLGIGGWQTVQISATQGARARSYFGVYSVTQTPAARMLTHGTTVHGIQLRTPGRERTPTSYYGATSGVGLAMIAAPRLFGDHARIGVVGLGAGTLALLCARRAGLALLRDRSGGGGDRARSAPLHLPVALPARRADPHRRRPADARPRARCAARSARRRRLLVGCGAGAPAHARGDGGLSPPAGAARAADGAHLQPLHGSGAGDRRRGGDRRLDRRAARGPARRRGPRGLPVGIDLDRARPGSRDDRAARRIGRRAVAPAGAPAGLRAVGPTITAASCRS